GTPDLARTEQAGDGENRRAHSPLNYFHYGTLRFSSGVMRREILTRAPEPRRNSMKLNSMMAAATAVAAIAISSASAQPYGPPQGRDQNPILFRRSRRWMA